MEETEAQKQVIMGIRVTGSTEHGRQLAFLSAERQGLLGREVVEGRGPPMGWGLAIQGSTPSSDLGARRMRPGGCPGPSSAARVRRA